MSRINLTVEPETIRSIVQKLTGIKISGVISRDSTNNQQKYNFRFNSEGTEFSCFQSDGSWYVAGPAPDGSIKVWSDRFSPEAEMGINLLSAFIKAKDGDLSPEFLVEFREFGGPKKKSIKRTYYNSRIGKITLHTRRVHPDPDIEGFIEIGGSDQVLSFVREAATGGIDPGKMSLLSEKPF
jgi:hypothetical protein